MDVWCLCCVFVSLCLCTGRGLARSWSPVQGVLPTVLDLVTEVKWKVSWRWPRPELDCSAKGGKNMKLHIYWKLMWSALKATCCIKTNDFLLHFIKYQGNTKVVPVFNYAPWHEDVWNSGGIAPCIRNFRTRSRIVVSFMSWPL
jgi:hypothetical protein